MGVRRRRGVLVADMILVLRTSAYAVVVGATGDVVNRRFFRLYIFRLLFRVFAKCLPLLNFTK